MPALSQWLNGDITPRVVAYYDVLPADRVSQLLDSVGDGSGVTEMATTADSYMYIPPAGYVVYLNRLNIFIEDGTKFQGELYAGVAALSNGIIVTIENPAGVIHTLTPQPVKKTGHWTLVAGVDVRETDYIAGDDTYMVRWTFARGNSPVRLDAGLGEFLNFQVRDTLAGLVSQVAQVQGRRVVRTP